MSPPHPTSRRLRIIASSTNNSLNAKKKAKKVLVSLSFKLKYTRTLSSNFVKICSKTNNGCNIFAWRRRYIQTKKCALSLKWVNVKITDKSSFRSRSKVCRSLHLFSRNSHLSNGVTWTSPVSDLTKWAKKRWYYGVKFIYALK